MEGCDKGLNWDCEMSEFKGTKGPWTLKKAPSLNGIFFKERQIGLIQGMDRDTNALLISKAPQMLEMLERIKSELPSDQSWAISLENDIEDLIKSATEL